MKQKNKKRPPRMPWLQKFTMSYGWLGALFATLWWSVIYIHAFLEFIRQFLPW